MYDQYLSLVQYRRSYCPAASRRLRSCFVSLTIAQFFQQVSQSILLLNAIQLVNQSLNASCSQSMRRRNQPQLYRKLVSSSPILSTNRPPCRRQNQAYQILVCYRISHKSKVNSRPTRSIPTTLQCSQLIQSAILRLQIYLIVAKNLLALQLIYVR